MHSVVTNGRAFASRAVGDPRAGLARVVGGPRPVESRSSSSRAPAPVAGGAPRRTTRSAEERCVDSWAVAGIEGAWTRMHRTPRRSLFTPHRVAGGPGKDQKLNKARTTTGRFVASGEEFKIVDCYTEPRASHMLLENAWTGTTEFQEISNHTKGISNILSWADWASEEEFEDVSKKRKGLPEMFDGVPDRRPLLSLSARDPQRRVDPVGGRWRGRPCTESALSPIARASDWIEGGRKLKVVQSSTRVARPVFGSPSKLFCCYPVCPESSLSPTTSMHVSSPEAQEVVGEGECQAGTDIGWCR